MQTMRERLVEALYEQCLSRGFQAGYSDAEGLADAVLDELREPENDMLAAGYEAMFEDKWDGTQAPMMGAGWQAMIDHARKQEG